MAKKFRNCSFRQNRSSTHVIYPIFNWNNYRIFRLLIVEKNMLKQNMNKVKLAWKILGEKDLFLLKKKKILKSKSLIFILSHSSELRGLCLKKFFKNCPTFAYENYCEYIFKLCWLEQHFIRHKLLVFEECSYISLGCG